MASWIDYVKSISETKEYMFDGDYPAFMINRAMACFPDTLPFADRMNQSPNLPDKMQYEFYLGVVSRRKRFAKWTKPIIDDDVELLKRHYNISDTKASQAKRVLSEEELDEIRGYYFEGGRRK